MICYICKEEKPPELMYRNGRCKPCSAAYRLAHQQGEYKERMMARRTPEYYRKVNLKSAWGMSPEDFAARLEKQGGKCAICDTTTPGGKGAFHIDHDHSTGKIRGLLCHRCNVGLGQFQDNIDRLERAKEYLKSGT